MARVTKANCVCAIKVPSQTGSHEGSGRQTANYALNTLLHSQPACRTSVMQMSTRYCSDAGRGGEGRRSSSAEGEQQQAWQGHAGEVPSGGCLPQTNGRTFYPPQLAGHAGCCPRQQQRRTPPETAPVRACIQKTLVAGTCASQRFLVAFFMRRYVSACRAARAAPGVPCSRRQEQHPSLPDLH